MNITLQIVLRAPNHTLSNAQNTAARYRRGDIVGVYKRSEVVESPSNPRLGFVHITGVPITSQQFERVKRRLTTGMYSPEVGLAGRGLAGRTTLRRRKWRLLASAVPLAARNTLMAQGEITVSWAVAKSYFRRKVITNNLDPSLDDETNTLTDADL